MPFFARGRFPGPLANCRHVRISTKTPPLDPCRAATTRHKQSRQEGDTTILQITSDVPIYHRVEQVKPLTVRALAEAIRPRADEDAIAFVSRRIRHWTLAGALETIGEARSGVGRHRRYTREAAYFAAVLDALADLGLPIDALKKVGSNSGIGTGRMVTHAAAGSMRSPVKAQSIFGLKSAFRVVNRIAIGFVFQSRMRKASSAERGASPWMLR